MGDRLSYTQLSFSCSETLYQRLHRWLTIPYTCIPYITANISMTSLKLPNHLYVPINLWQCVCFIKSICGVTFLCLFYNIDLYNDNHIISVYIVFPKQCMREFPKGLIVADNGRPDLVPRRKMMLCSCHFYVPYKWASKLR